MNFSKKNVFDLIVVALATFLIFMLLVSVPFISHAQEEPTEPDIPTVENPFPEDSPLFPFYENIIGVVGIGATLVLTLTALSKRIPILRDYPMQHVSTVWTLIVFFTYLGLYYSGLANQYPDLINGLNTIGVGLLGLLGTSVAAEFGYRGAKAANLPVLGYSKNSDIGQTKPFTVEKWDG